MKKIIVCSILILRHAFCCEAFAECSPNEAKQAEASAANLKNWNEIQNAYKKYSHCDDGAIAEGYSESISQMLANHWDQLSTLEKLAGKDQKFENFVIKHVDETIAKENARKIVENARNKCPERSRSFCKKIEHATRR